MQCMQREKVWRKVLSKGLRKHPSRRAMVLARMHCAMPFSLLELQRLQVGARGVRGAFMGCTLSIPD
jgi:hypothetical protein